MTRNPCRKGSGYSLRKSHLWWTAFGLGWFSLVAGGLGTLIRYQNAPGAAAQPPGHWPAESQISRDPIKPTLVMVVHPFCPCSRSSLRELAKLTAQCDQALQISVVFCKPEAFSTQLEETDLWHIAGNIPGVERFADYGGTETERFRAYTSGQVLFYDAGGRLQFSGGLTPSRGHEGDNVGRAAIVRFIRGGAAGHFESFTFGCPLYSEIQPRELCCPE